MGNITALIRRASLPVGIVGLFTLVPPLPADAVNPLGHLVLGCWILVALCLWYTRRVRKRAPGSLLRDNAGAKYHLCAYGVLYLVPIGIAMTSYLFLALYVSRAGDSLPVDRLISMQRLFEQVSTFFSANLKLSEAKVLIVLLVVYLLSCALLSRRGERAQRGSGRRRLVAALHRMTGFFTTYSGPVAAGLATLASFTFFGLQLGTPAEELRVRVKVIQEGYAEIAEKVESELSERVAVGLHEKIRNGFPSSYRRALAESHTVADLVGRVRQRADEARSTYGIRVPAAEAAIRKAVRAGGLGDTEQRVRIAGTDRAAPPADTTLEQVRRTRSTMNLHDRPGEIDLVEEGRRKVVLQVEKLVSERIVALTKPLTEAVPLLDPLLQAFVEAVDKTVQDRIGQAYDRAMQTAMREPRNLDAVLEHEARTLVEETNVEPFIDHVAEQARELAAEQRRTLSALKKGESLIDRRVERHRAREARTARRQRVPRLNLRPLPELPPLLDAPKPLPRFFPYPDYRPHYPYRPPYQDLPHRFSPPRPVIPKPPPPRPPRIFIP